MLKIVIALSVALTVVRPSGLWAADETSWQPESAEAAERQLEKTRKAAGTLRRYETDVLVSAINITFQTEQRSRVHAYVEEAAGYLFEVRPFDISHMTGRQTPTGGPCRLSTQEPQTWLYTNGELTIVDEVHRSYDTMEIRPKSLFAPVRTTPHQILPPWLDPTLDWKELKSRYRIDQAKSTGTEFFVYLVPRKKAHRGQWISDERLSASHQLVIDRRTCLPKKWRMTNDRRDQMLIFSRFDVNPAKRELKLALSGYHKGRAMPQTDAGPTKDVKETPDGLSVLTLCFRLLVWWLF